MKKCMYNCIVVFKEDIERHRSGFENNPSEFADTYGQQVLIFSGSSNDLPDAYEDDDVFFYLNGKSIEHLTSVNNGEDFIVLEWSIDY